MATANAATTYLENRLLSLIFKNNAASFSTASGWTLTAESADTQTIKNAGNIEFDPSTGSTQTITHVFITTAASASLDVVGSGGNVLFIGALDASKVIASGDIFRINQDNLTIELK
jgi:hypothetical protein